MDHQQQQQIQQTHSNLINSPHVILTRSNSTVILNEEQIHLPAALLTNHNTALRSLLKTSGLFNKDMESSDQLNEFFANGNEFTLHRFLSDFNANDMNIDMNELVKFDPSKLLDIRSISEFLQCDSFDQINTTTTTTTTTDIQSSQLDSVLPSAITCSSESFAEFYPPTPELITKEVFHTDSTQLKMEPENPLIYTELNSFDNLVFTPPTSTSASHEFNFDPSALAAFEHDYGYLSKRATVVDTPSPSPIISKRTPIRKSRRTSSRLQSRATLIGVSPMLSNDSYSSSAFSDNGSISSKKPKHSHNVHRATDIKTEDDLSYYLERRRKNNEASKMSRAARKQKFGDMGLRCSEYERVNTELRLKISTLEVVTASLKSGLIHSFQHKGVVNSNS